MLPWHEQWSRLTCEHRGATVPHRVTNITISGRLWVGPHLNAGQKAGESSFDPPGPCIAFYSCFQHVWYTFTRGSDHGVEGWVKFFFKLVVVDHDPAPYTGESILRWCGLWTTLEWRLMTGQFHLLLKLRERITTITLVAALAIGRGSTPRSPPTVFSPAPPEFLCKVIKVISPDDIFWLLKAKL